MGLSKGDFANRLEVSLGTLHNWTFGRRKPSRRFWPRIAALLAND
jgi:DNA-binding transcriptional regulator YiaG